MTDDEIVEMMRKARDTSQETRNPAETDRNRMAAILARIRPLLEARGIEMAAEQIDKYCKDGMSLRGALECTRALARRHAEGGES